MVDKQMDTVTEMVEKPDVKVKKLKTFVIQPANVKIEAENEKEAAMLFNKLKK